MTLPRFLSMLAHPPTTQGKTLVAVLPAYLNALSTKGVHVVTVNDYLARRDSEWVGQVHRFLGLKVSARVRRPSMAQAQGLARRLPRVPQQITPLKPSHPHWLPPAAIIAHAPSAARTSRHRSCPSTFKGGPHPVGHDAGCAARGVR